MRSLSRSKGKAPAGSYTVYPNTLLLRCRAPALDAALAANGPQALLGPVGQLRKMQTPILGRRTPALDAALAADGPQALLGQVGRRLAGRPAEG